MGEQKSENTGSLKSYHSVVQFILENLSLFISIINIKYTTILFECLRVLHNLQTK